MTFVEAAKGTHVAKMTPIKPRESSLEKPSINIHTIPMQATNIANQVRTGIFSRKKIHAKIAVNKGDKLSTISALATVVMVMANMKQENIEPHMRPENAPYLPSARILPNTR